MTSSIRMRRYVPTRRLDHHFLEHLDQERPRHVADVGRLHRRQLGILGDQRDASRGRHNRLKALEQQGHCAGEELDRLVVRDVAHLDREAKPHPSATRQTLPRVDDRRVISGIVHVLKSGGRWVDSPDVYGPRKTLYNCFVRWAACADFS